MESIAHYFLVFLAAFAASALSAIMLNMLIDKRNRKKHLVSQYEIKINGIIEFLESHLLSETTPNHKWKNDRESAEYIRQHFVISFKQLRTLLSALKRLKSKDIQKLIGLQNKLDNHLTNSAAEEKFRKYFSASDKLLQKEFIRIT